MKKLIFLLIIFFSFSIFAGLLKPLPQKESVFIGEELEIKVETAPAKIMSARFAKENNEMAITGVSATADGKALVIKLITLKNGELETPGIELSLDGRISNVESFKISSKNRTQENDMNLRDIKEPVKIMEKDYTLIYVLLGLSIAVILFFVIRKILKKLKKIEKIIPKKVIPSEVAAQFLKEAKEKRKIGDLEAFVDLVTFGLRTYMSLKCMVNYREMTTYEIRRELRKDVLFSKYDKRIIDILKLGDRFKFADELLVERDFDRLFDEFGNIVNEIEKAGVNSNAVS